MITLLGFLDAAANLQGMFGIIQSKSPIKVPLLAMLRLVFVMIELIGFSPSEFAKLIFTPRLIKHMMLVHIYYNNNLILVAIWQMFFFQNHICELNRTPAG